MDKDKKRVMQKLFKKIRDVFTERRLPWFLSSRIDKINEAIKILSEKHFLGRLRIGNFIIKYRRNTGDLGVIEEVVIDDAYSVADLNLKDGSVVIDIGAHIGCFTIKLSSLVKNCKIFCFEPAPDNFRILSKNIRSNRLGNVFLYKKAVLERSGISKLYVSGTKWHTSIHSCVKNISGQAISVKAVSLAEILDRNRIDKLDLLKIDCEGAEYQILSNLHKEALDRIGKIVMEYHVMGENGQLQALETYLEKNGFKIMEVRPNATKPEVGIAYFSKNT